MGVGSVQRGMVDFQWPETRAFACDRHGMAEALAWMEEGLGRVACGDAPTRRAMLVLDELYANTLLHGGEAARCGCVEIAIERTAGDLLIFYADAGAAFDTARAADCSRPPAEGRVGGAGLLLLQRLSRLIRYERFGERNRTVVVLPLGAPATD